MKNSFRKSADWISSKGARSIQFIKTSVTEQHESLPDTHHQDVITLKQSCISKGNSISIERRIQGEDGVFHFAHNPYAGISLDPDEWATVIAAMQELSR